QPAVNDTNSRGFPALDSKDRLLVAGSTRDGGTGETTTYLARFDARMNLDVSFGADATGVAEIGNRALGTFIPYSAATDKFGRIVVAGQLKTEFSYYNKVAEMVVRLRDDSIVSNVVEFYNASFDHYFIT